MDNDKIFRGGKPIEMEITRLIDRMQKIQSIIKDSDKNPDIYLKEQLFENLFEAQFVLNNAYISYGEKAVDGFQIDFIQKVFTTLKSNITTTDFSFETLIDENGLYYIQISAYFLEDNIPILNIYPYFKQYEELDCERMIYLQNLEAQAIEEAEEYKNQIEFLKQCYKNPALYANGNVKLYMQMSNKRKRDEILSAELMQANMNYKIANEHLMNIQDEIKIMEDTLNSIYIMRDRYTERLRNRFRYIAIIHTEELEEENTENKLFENSIEEKSNKVFFSQMINEEKIEYPNNFEPLDKDIVLIDLNSEE